jgi:hypothetical protein
MQINNQHHFLRPPAISLRTAPGLGVREACGVCGQAAMIRILGWVVVFALAFGGPGLLVWALWQ